MKRSTTSSVRSLSRESQAERAERIASDPWGGKRRSTAMDVGKSKAARSKSACRGRVSID